MTGLALLPDWTLASVSHDRTIRLWDLHTFKLINTVRDAHATPLQGIDYSPDTNEVVTFAMDNLAYVWDAVRLQARYALLGHTAEVTQVGLALAAAFAILVPLLFAICLASNNTAVIVAKYVLQVWHEILFGGTICKSHQPSNKVHAAHFCYCKGCLFYYL